MAENTQTDPQVIGNTPVPGAPLPTTAPAPGSDQVIPHAKGLYGETGMMTHAGMLHTLKSGGSVIHEGRVISRPEDLPTPAEVSQRDVAHAQTLLKNATNDRERDRAKRILQLSHEGTKTTKADLDAQIASLQAQRASLPEEDAKKQAAAK